MLLLAEYENLSSSQAVFLDSDFSKRSEFLIEAPSSNIMSVSKYFSTSFSTLQKQVGKRIPLDWYCEQVWLRWTGRILIWFFESETL